MPDFIPFKAIRPPREYVHLVGSRSYMNYNEQDVLVRLSGNPYSFLHVIMSEELTLKGNDLTFDEKFEIVRNKFEEFCDKGYLKKDKKARYYLYRQTKDNHPVVGIIGGIAAHDYDSGKIKVHEQTITKREKLFEKYLDITGFNAEPVLLTYEDSESINSIVDIYLKKRAVYKFSTTDMVKHEFWLIKKEEHQEIIKAEFKTIDSVYIADGHHRCASSALIAKHGNGSAVNDHFMALMVPKSRLKIFDYNRIVKDLNGLTAHEFLIKVNESFDVEKTSNDSTTIGFKSEEKGTMSMFLDGDWYKITIKKELIPNTVVGQLDTRILTEQILTPILGIEDLKTDSRIDFLNGTYGMIGLQNAVSYEGYKVAFGLFPVSFDQLKEVSDTNNIMPPKSTWIEPKLRSGIIVYELNED